MSLSKSHQITLLIPRLTKKRRLCNNPFWMGCWTDGTILKQESSNLIDSRLPFGVSLLFSAHPQIRQNLLLLSFCIYHLRFENLWVLVLMYPVKETKLRFILFDCFLSAVVRLTTGCTAAGLTCCRLRSFVIRSSSDGFPVPSTRFLLFLIIINNYGTLY